MHGFKVKLISQDPYDNLEKWYLPISFFLGLLIWLLFSTSRSLNAIWKWLKNTQLLNHCKMFHNSWQNGATIRIIGNHRVRWESEIELREESSHYFKTCIFLIFIFQHMQLFCRVAMHVNQNRPYTQTTVRRYKNEISFHDFFIKQNHSISRTPHGIKYQIQLSLIKYKKNYKIYCSMHKCCNSKLKPTLAN